MSLKRFVIEKTIEVPASHHLKLPYESPCTRTHGHNYVITVKICSDTLNTEGMVVDFAKVKKLINDLFDHKDLNKQLPKTISNTTTENFACYLANLITSEFGVYCEQVVINETRDNKVIYNSSSDEWEA